MGRRNSVGRIAQLITDLKTKVIYTIFPQTPTPNANKMEESPPVCVCCQCDCQSWGELTWRGGGKKAASERVKIEFHLPWREHCLRANKRMKRRPAAVP